MLLCLQIVTMFCNFNICNCVCNLFCNFVTSIIKLNINNFLSHIKTSIKSNQSINHQSSIIDLETLVKKLFLIILSAIIWQGYKHFGQKHLVNWHTDKLPYFLYYSVHMSIVLTLIWQCFCRVNNFSGIVQEFCTGNIWS